MKTAVLALLLSPLFTFAQSISDLPSITKVEFVSKLQKEKTIQNFLRAQVDDHVEPVIQIINLINHYYVRGGSSAIGELLDQVLRSIEENPEEFQSAYAKERFAEPIENLLRRFVFGRQHEQVVEITDRLWLWAPEHLPFLASKIRNNLLTNFTTQTLWALRGADNRQKMDFFAEVDRDAIVNWNCRWFPMAVGMLHGRRYPYRDELKFLRSLSMVSIDNIRPPPKPRLYQGKLLMTSEDLYKIAVARFRARALKRDPILLKVRNLAKEKNEAQLLHFMKDLFNPRKRALAAEACQEALIHAHEVTDPS